MPFNGNDFNNEEVLFIYSEMKMLPLISSRGGLCGEKRIVIVGVVQIFSSIISSEKTGNTSTILKVFIAKIAESNISNCNELSSQNITGNTYGCGQGNAEHVRFGNVKSDSQSLKITYQEEPKLNSFLI